MCGLIAAFHRSGAGIGDDALRAGLARLARRGPDGEGVWREDGVVLGHRRLAIIDLDPRAAQPMHSPCGRYVIAYNGEIYNYRELRRAREAAGTAFRTTSDTEVILALFAAEGEAMLPRLHGMFAFAIWDRTARRGFVARDPYGIKPLYYTRTTQGTLVASQVRALLATGLVPREPDPDGQAGYWLLGSVPEPHTWFRDVRALPAGHSAWIDADQPVTPRCWHDIGDAWRSAASVRMPRAELREVVGTAVRESVTRHLVADVPIGVFLSAGIDSGAVAALMVEAGARSLEGITLAYDEYAGTARDEAPVAARLAARYGIRHHVRRVARDEFRADLPRILDAMDQPSVDGVNTWYASKAVAERGLKVVVSGVGGDELFQGYPGFRTLPWLVTSRLVLGALPGAVGLLRRIAERRARATGNARWRHLPDWSRTIAGAWWLRRGVYGPEDLASLMGPDVARAALRDVDPDSDVARGCGPLPADARLALGLIESVRYLRNQLLRDGDWASMDHGVELRTPLVDAWLLEQLRPVLRETGRVAGKRLLAETPATPLPSDVAARAKTGFGIPVERWLGREGSGAPPPDLRGWAREVARAYEMATA